MPGIATETISPGFMNPVLSNQRVFRAILQTMSRPGTVTVLGNRLTPPNPLHPAVAALCLALVDMDTPLWLDAPVAADASAYLRFHCGCPIADKREEAAFAVVLDSNNLPNLFDFHPGNLEYPDRSATVIIQVNSLDLGCGVRLRGPGIRDIVRLDASGLPTGFWRILHQNNQRFPLGVDVILASETEIVSLPRTVQVEV